MIRNPVFVFTPSTFIQMYHFLLVLALSKLTEVQYKISSNTIILLYFDLKDLSIHITENSVRQLFRNVKYSQSIFSSWNIVFSISCKTLLVWFCLLWIIFVVYHIPTYLPKRRKCKHWRLQFTEHMRSSRATP